VAIEKPGTSQFSYTSHRSLERAESEHGRRKGVGCPVKWVGRLVRADEAGSAQLGAVELLPVNWARPELDEGGITGVVLRRASDVDGRRGQMVVLLKTR
jgi:hypothetical protein